MQSNARYQLYLLPFLYYYTLSIATLMVCVYLLVKIPSGTVSVTYAKNENQIANYGYNINLSAGTEETVKVDKLDQFESFICDQQKAKKIDDFFATRKAPLAGNGCSFVYHAEQNDIDPYLIAGIAWCESNGGKVTPQFGNKESYNAWGWGVLDSNDNTRELGAYACDSWDHCIGRVTRGIARKSTSGKTPVDIVKWYTPASVAKADGVASNAPWVKCVTQQIENISLGK